MPNKIYISIEDLRLIDPEFLSYLVPKLREQGIEIVLTIPSNSFTTFSQNNTAFDKLYMVSTLKLISESIRKRFEK